MSASCRPNGDYRSALAEPAIDPRRQESVARLSTLHPGDVACGVRGDRFETLLGSCIALVLTDPRRTVGAICHVVHSKAASPDATDATAHAPEALHRMQALLQARGIVLPLCEAYLYGGGNMFPDLVRQPHVGSGNVDWALDYLQRHRIRLLAQDVGGNCYRRLAWTVGVGEPRVTAMAI